MYIQLLSFDVWNCLHRKGDRCVPVTMPLIHWTRCKRKIIELNHNHPEMKFYTICAVKNIKYSIQIENHVYIFCVKFSVKSFRRIPRGDRHKTNSWTTISWKTIPFMCKINTHKIYDIQFSFINYLKIQNNWMKFNILEQMECALRTHATHTFVRNIQWNQYDGTICI